jgi:regulator of protease activity HflC (stomatin/prohibitin superfamily)
MSKEGIPVTCDVDVVFQIQSGDEKPTGERPFPADMDAVFTAATSKWIREADLPEGDRVLDWKALVVVSGAQGTLRFILARYPLDRLIAPEREGETHPRRAIRDELGAALRLTAKNVGAKILRVELGQIKVADKVTQKWIESWRAHWDRWGAEYLAEADAAYVKTVGEAQAEAIALRIRNTANVLHGLALESRRAFYTGARMQLQLMLRNVGADSLALTYLPGEATKLLQGPEGIKPPSEAKDPTAP